MKQSLLSYSLLQKRPDRVRERDPRHFVCTLLRETSSTASKDSNTKRRERNIAFYLQQRTCDHDQPRAAA